MTDYYAPKFLRGVIQKVLPLRMFFRTKFFTDTVTYTTETVSFEFAQDKRGLLPYANPRRPAPAVDREGYQLKRFTPPLVSGSRTITPDTASMKELGELEWNSGVSPDERAARIAANDLMQLQDRLFRREEYMCARVKQDGILELPHETVNYGFTNIENTTNANKWNANYDLIGKLRSKSVALRKDGTNPDMLILGTDAATAFMNNTGIKDALLHQAGYLIEPHDEDYNGAHFVCRLRVPGLYLDVYEYDEYYYDEATATTLPVMDPGTAILQSSQERNYMLFGAVNYVENRSHVTAVGEYIPRTIWKEDPSAQILIVESRPLPMPRDVESWCVMKNVA